MSDDESAGAETRQNTAVVAHEKNDGSDNQPQYEMFPLREMLEVERERIDSQNRRTEVAKQAIEAQDAADKRQYDFHVRRLNSEDSQSIRQHGLARGVFWGGGGFFAIVSIFILVMLFFGDADQAASARSILSVVGQALGGAGFLYLMVRAIRWLLTR